MIDNDLYQYKFIKRKGKIRKIVTYKNEGIRKKHEKINDFLNKNLFYSKFSKAYIKGSSIFYNAKAHLYNDIFISLDIEKFFNNIDHNLLKEILYFELNKFEENGIKIGRIECAKIIEMCSVSQKGLPLGLIPSPSLANIYLKEFDNVLYGKLKKMNLSNVIYTRYADDLTISFKNSNEENDYIKNEIIDIVSKLLRRYKLKLNIKKTRYINFEISNHVRITGVNIIKDKDNYRRLSVGRKLKKEFFYKTIACYREYLKDPVSIDVAEIRKIKGMESFILSIEKEGYEGTFSPGMQEVIESFGFRNLSDLIKKLPL